MENYVGQIVEINVAPKLECVGVVTEITENSNMCIIWLERTSILVAVEKSLLSPYKIIKPIEVAQLRMKYDNWKQLSNKYSL